MIFKMFFSTKHKPEAGFGLSEPRKFARHKQGTSTPDNQLRQGSTISLRSPMVIERAYL
jgi:signal transduction histidine kinase